jgi:hypothetical protein
VVFSCCSGSPNWGFVMDFCLNGNWVIVRHLMFFLVVWICCFNVRLNGCLD